MSGHLSHDLHLVRHSSYTQNGDATVRIAAFIWIFKRVNRHKYLSLLCLGNVNQNKINEIFTNDMFLQC